MRIPKIFILFLFILALFKTGLSQDQSPEIGIAATSHYGFIVAHRSNIHHLSTAHLTIHELSLEKKIVKGETSDFYKKHVTGITLLYSELGFNKFLGKSFALMPYIDLPLASGKKISLDLKVASGLGYLTKPFHRTENYKNIAIGSRLNAAISLLPRIHLKPTENISLKIGSGLTHFSNGSFKTPNLGINLWTLNAQVTYYFLDSKNKAAIPFDTLKRSWYLQTFLSAGNKQIYPAGGKSYLTKTFSINYKKRFTHKSAAGFGLDLFHDPSIYVKMVNDSVLSPEKVKSFKAGITLDYELLLGRLSIPMEMGFYVPDGFNYDGFFFHRFGWRYKLTDKWRASLTLKTHFAKADYIEWGLGYTFL